MSAAGRFKRDLGLPGALAIAVLGAALAAHLWLVRPQETRLEGLQQELAARVAASRDGAEEARTPGAKLAAFYAFFRREEPQVDWLAKLYGTARANGLELRSTEYRYHSGDGRLELYQLSVPVSGPYLGIRQFIDEALLEIPVMSLDQLALRRKRPGDAHVEADISFTLHLPRR